MNTQPEALRIADAVERYNAGVHSQAIYEDYSRAAAELRRIHALNQKLEQENTKLWGWYHDAEQHLAVLQGRAKAGGTATQTGETE